MKPITDGIAPRSDSLLTTYRSLKKKSKLNVKRWEIVSLDRQNEKYPGGEITVPSGVQNKELVELTGKTATGVGQL